MLDKEYWDGKWQVRDTGWDMGSVSPAIADYINQLPHKNIAILIPGCGNAWEAEYLLQRGFSNITLLDISQVAIENLKKKFSNYTQVKIICEDFFHHQGSYDLIIEQTFFCAIHPSRRKEYVVKSASLLKENGRIAGLLFNRQFHQATPPFGGNTDEYKALFGTHFNIKEMSICYNSILPRMGTEVFIILIKK